MNSEEVKLNFLHSIAKEEELENKLIKDFVGNSVVQTLAPGAVISNEGDSCSYFTFIINGSVRVFKVSESGKEITLYRLNKGDSCILTASCILSASKFPAISVAEAEVDGILVPANVFRNWVESFRFWRKYVYDLMAERLNSVITIVEEVAFKRMDARIAEFILERSLRSGNILNLTHKDIAYELGTAREVVSRLLKDFEKKGIIKLERGQINIIDVSKLKRLM